MSGRKKRKPLEYFKFFWRDFNRDTAHLTRAQRDGYLQIICAYYDNHGSLHENAAMKVSGATSSEWKIDRDVMAKFFRVDSDKNWHHKRIESELKEVRLVSKKRAISGSAGGKRKANAKQLLNKNLATKDVSNEFPSKTVPIARKRLSKTEEELITAKERVWQLENEASKAQAEIELMNLTGDNS